MFFKRITNLNLNFTKDEWLLEQRIKTIAIMVLFVIFMFGLFSIMRFIRGDIVAALADGIGALIFVGLNILLRKDKKYYNIISITVVAVISIIISIILFTSSYELIRGVWFIAILVLAYYLRDAKEGLMWMLFYISILLVNLFLNPNPDIVAYIVVIVNLFFVSVVLHFYEKIKYKETEIIEEQKEILEKEVKKRTAQLNHLNTNLEQKIKDEVNKNIIKDKMMVQQNKMAMMGEMIGNIAHQFRQPLSAISTTSSSLVVDIELDMFEENRAKDRLNKISGFVTHLSNTIDDFRNFFKEDKEKIQFNLAKSITTDLFIIESTTLNNNIKIIKNFDKTIELKTFKNELTQSILNILNNAKDALIESIPKNNSRLIFIDIKQNNDKIEIIIRDNAGGIPEDIIHKIFDENFTTKIDNDGTGIGLFMTKQMIEKNIGGTLNVTNKEFSYNEQNYKGAQFIVTL